MTSTKASPALLERIDRLTGCQGHWVLIRDGEPETDCSHQWHQDHTEHLATCLAEHWRGVSLGFVPSYCGYSDYATTGLVGLSNFRVLTDPASTPDPHGGILEVGYGWNGRGVVLDLLRVPADVLETVEALESYPLISEDDHSELELEHEAEAWENWAMAEWRGVVEKALQEFAPDDADRYWADEQLERVSDDAMGELWHTVADRLPWCCQHESYGPSFNFCDAAEALTRSDLADLTGLALLPADQEWRRESYPWPDGSSGALAPALA